MSMARGPLSTTNQGTPGPGKRSVAKKVKKADTPKKAKQTTKKRNVVSY